MRRLEGRPRPLCDVWPVYCAAESGTSRVVGLTVRSHFSSLALIMKFAFSTVSCPKWDFETIALRAKEYGYDGVEIRGFLNESILTASNVFLTDPGKFSRIFGEAGI